MVAHSAILRGVDLAAGPAGIKPWPPAMSPPTLLQRTDQDFVNALLTGLSSTEGWHDLAQTLVRPQSGGLLRLFQPVHRTFHLVVLELVCPRPGQPRIDPASIESSGMVLRRCTPEPHNRQGWMREQNQVVGWVSFQNGAQEDLDPDPERRRGPLAAVAPQLLARMPVRRSPWDSYSESVTTLFVAPPEVCKAVGRTLLFGVVPLTSSEHTEGASRFQYDMDFVKTHLPDLLQASSTTVGGMKIKQVVPRPGAAVTEKDADSDDLQKFIDMLTQLLVELNVFDETAGPARTPGQRLFDAINQIQLPYRNAATRQVAHRPAGAFLRDAAMVLVNRNKKADLGATSVTMPESWPTIDDEVLAPAIAAAAKEALEDRLRGVAQQQGRFEELDPNSPTPYRLRAFVRLRRPDGCPPELLWSQESEPFAIAPWFDSGVLPPVKVALPPVDRNWVKTVKPNVAFQVPGNLFEFLRKIDPLNVFKGQIEEGGSSTLNWICGFNIPLITICAFIVLTIFLILLNIVFFWLPFIRICIPIPQSKRGG